RVAARFAGLDQLQAGFDAAVNLSAERASALVIGQLGGQGSDERRGAVLQFHAGTAGAVPAHVHAVLPAIDAERLALVDPLFAHRGDELVDAQGAGLRVNGHKEALENLSTAFEADFQWRAGVLQALQQRLDFQWRGDFPWRLGARPVFG